MTHDEILKMPAGREMDELVIQQFMKWKVIWRGDTGYAYNDGKYGARINWHPSTDIAAAWEVMEKGFEMGYPFRLFGYTGDWSCTMRFTAYAEIAPLAICRAALFAVMELQE